ncbi:hypothetical protein MRB53_004803 [Persea americana]|uniref:Uncharacterized protein n=1 Tax=Persea americana TaxID=3435 RepID=A0ACC2MC68_PERAE|nr:hypothetical protein MRB53_004803 [Persea americana]
MGKNSAQRGHRTFEPNVKADIDDMYGGYEGNGVEKNGNDDVLFEEMTLQELEIYKGKKREVLGDNKGGDELLFDNMALQELKIYGKELKISKSAGPTKANVESSRKRNYSHSQFEGAELDLEERTCYLKSRLSKQLKVENEWAEDCSFLIKPEQESTLFSVNQDLLAVAMPRASIKCEPLLYNSGYLCGLDNIKTEIIETKSYFLQNAACFADCSAANCFADVNSSESSLELLGKVDLGQLESEKSTPFPEKLEGFLDRVDDKGELEMKESAFFNNEFLQCSLNEASTNYFEDMEESTNFTMNLSGESFDGSSDNFDGGELEMSGSTSFTEGTLYCSLNEASTEYMEEKEESTYFIEEMGLPGESSNGFPDVRELDTEELSSTNNESIPCLNEALTHCEPGRSTFLQEIAENHCCRPFTSELMIEGLLPHELSAGNSEEISFLNIPGSETHHNSIGPSSQEISCQVHKNTVTQVSDMAIDDSPQSSESTAASYGCISGLQSEDLGDNADENPIDCEVPTDSVKDTSIAHGDHSTRGTNGPYSSPLDSKDSVSASNSSFDGRSPQDSKPSVLASVDESVKTSIQICPSNGTDGLNAMESFDNFHGEKPKRPPERLLSTRKAISPTCQETLRRAMTTEELYESVEISSKPYVPL